MELDLLGMRSKQTPMPPTTSSKPSFKKLLDRRRSFRDIQGAISKINPEIIKSVIASGNQLDSPRSSPKEDEPQIPAQPVHFPIPSSDSEKAANSAPMTIFYNGTVHVFDLSREKAESIMKFASEGSSNKDGSFQQNSSYLSKQEQKFIMNNVNGDLPIARTKSLQRFLDKRKERLISASPYSFPNLKHVS